MRYGEKQDCPSGCFVADSSRGQLVRLTSALSRHGWPQLRSMLLEHPVVVADRESLTMLTQVRRANFAVRDAARGRLDPRG